MHLIGKPQENVEEQLAAKKALPDTWDSEDDEEAERQVAPPALQPLIAFGPISSSCKY